MKKYRIGEKIRHFRELRGFSQAEFAKKAGLTQAAISQFENNKRIPSGQSLINLVRELNLSVDALFCDD